MPAKRLYKKRPAKSKKSVKKATLNKQIKKVVFKAKPRKEERFYSDRSLSTDTLANSFESIIISNVAQGDAFNQRIGKKIYVSGVRLSLLFQNNSAAKTKFVRVMLLREKSSQGTTLNTSTWANLYRDENFADIAPAMNSRDVTYPLNTGMLQIFFDRVFKIQMEAESAFYLNRFIPIKRTLSYDADGSGNVPTNGEILVVAHLCDGDDSTTTASVKMRAMYRLHYKDA